MSVVELNDYVQLTRRGVADIGAKESREISWGYGWCKDQNDEILYELYHAVKLLRDQELVGEVCICEDEVDNIKSHIHRILGPDCKVKEKDFLREDNPNATAWLLSNPDCQSYEFMADFLAAQCQKVGLDFKIIERRCQDVDLDLKTSNLVTCESINLALQIEEKTCDIDLIPTLTLQDCVNDFVAKITPLNCGVSLKAFVTALNCGASVKLIVDELSCAVDLGLDVNEVLSTICLDLSEQEVDVVLPFLPFTVSVDDNTVCYFTDVEVSIDVIHPDATYTWNFGSGAVPATGTGFGPHTIQYSTSGSKTITVTGVLGAEDEVDTATVTVAACPGNITGTTEDTFGNPLQSVNVRLYLDANADGVPDGAFVNSVFSGVNGTWSIVGKTPGNYVIAPQSVPNYTLVSGIDTTPDGDVVANVPTTDVFIPVTVTPQDIDADNDYIYTPNSGTISGTVLDDLASPIEGIDINIYEDFNLDDVADGPAIATVSTNASGVYTASVPSGPQGFALANKHYIIELDVPVGYTIVSGIDNSEDFDLVANIPTTDNLIPCTLSSGEIDAQNDFIIQLV